MPCVQILGSMASRPTHHPRASHPFFIPSSTHTGDSQVSSLQCMPTESYTIILPFLHIVHLHHDTVLLGPPPELLLQLVLHPGFLSSHPHGLFHSLPLSHWLPHLFTLNSYLVLCSPHSVLTFIPDSHLPHILCSPTAF